ncbi:MAG: type IV pilus twitching motility protein PilT [Armatimonadota bacterium]
MKSIHELLETAFARKASDILIKAGSPPAIRVDGCLELASSEALSPDEAEDLVHSIIYSSIRDYLLQAGEVGMSGDDLVERKVKTLHEMEEIDLVFTIPGLARVRANLFMQRNAVGATLRVVPLVPQSIDELSLPQILKEWAGEPQGLVVITGPTGSGKSTTVAAMVEHINTTRRCHVVTIEDPIEHVHAGKESIVTQREIGSDTRSYAAALYSVLRQTPDVIVIGEMRDAETMSAAITAAEVGHLVIATLHTTSAPATVDRILNSLPAESRRQAAMQLSQGLVGIASQRLVVRADGGGRLPAVEIMTGSPTVRKLIEEMELSELPAAVREGNHYGMTSMNQALKKLCQAKAITVEQALLAAGNSAELRQMLRRPNA